jgi:DNA repair exonuclease SbcCD ATPase subunit
LGGLQAELLKPKALQYISTAVEREVKRALAAGSTVGASLQRQLDAEKRKLQNLVTATEGGSSPPAALLKAISEREANIKRLETELRKSNEKPTAKRLPDIPDWVRDQLQNLRTLLKSDPPRVKAEFRRLNLQLTFQPIEAKPRPHYIVNGQCDLSALAVSFVRARAIKGAVLDSMGEYQVHSRTQFCWCFR